MADAVTQHRPGNFLRIPSQESCPYAPSVVNSAHRPGERGPFDHNAIIADFFHRVKFRWSENPFALCVSISRGSGPSLPLPASRRARICRAA